MANDRISQLPVEAVVSPTSGKARTSQEAIEVVVIPTSAKARESQVAVEVIVAPTSAKARTSQLVVEVIVQNVSVQTINGSLTADAILKRTQSATFTADAILKKTPSTTLAADAVLKATVSGSFTADASIARTTAASFTADAVLKRAQGASLTIDAVIKRTQSATLTADAVIATGVGAGAFTLDAILKRAQAGSFTLDAAIVSTTSGSFTADAVLKATQSGSFTADASISKTISGSFIADALIFRTVSGSLTANSILRRSQSASFTADAVVAGRFRADAVIKATITGAFTASAWIYAPRADPGGPGAPGETPLVSIIVGGVDITADVVLSEATFTTLTNGAIGQCSVKVRDDDHTHNFSSGAEITVDVDGKRKFGGYITQPKRGFAFPVEDTTDPDRPSRFITLEGVDYNILMTKRVVYNKASPANVNLRSWAAGSRDDVVIKYIFDNYTDLGADGVTYLGVTHVGSPNPDRTGVVGSGGLKFVDCMREINRLISGVFYIDPYKDLNFVDVDTPDAVYGLSDNPTAGEQGYRELTQMENGTKLINDALLWGAGQGSTSIKFGRATDSPSIAAHGRWQYGEFTTSLYKQTSVNTRVNSIVYGTAQGKRGGKDDQESWTLISYEPTFAVGQKVQISSDVFGKSDVVPVRRLTLTFPTKRSVKMAMVLSHEIDEPWNLFEFWFPSLPALGGIGGVPDFPPFDPPVIGGDGVCDCLGQLTMYDDFTRSVSPTGWGQPSSGNQAWVVGSYATPTYVDGTRAVIPYNIGNGDDAFDMSANGAGVGHIVNPPWGSGFVMQATVSYDTAVPGPSGNYDFAAFTFRWDGPSQIRQVDLYIGTEPDDPPVFGVRTVGGGASDAVPISAPPPNTPIYIKWESGDIERGKIWWGTDPEPDWMVSYTPTVLEQSNLRNFRVGGSTSYTHTSYRDDIAFTTDRCGAIQFESFARTVATGWGIATSGQTWSSSGTGSASVTNAGLIRTSSGNTRTLSITPPVTSTYEMTTMLRFSTVPSSTNYLRTVMDLGGGCYLQLDVSSGSPGKIYLGSGGNQVSVAKTDWASSTDYRIRESWDAGTGALKVKVWRAIDAEPGTWTLETTAAGPIGTLSVSGTNSGAGTNRDITFSFIEFGYSGKPCYPGSDCLNPTGLYSDTFTRTVSSPSWGTADVGGAWSVSTGGSVPGYIVEVNGSEGRIYVPHPGTLDTVVDNVFVNLDGALGTDESFRILHRLKVGNQDLSIVDVTPYFQFSFATCTWNLEMGTEQTTHGQRLTLTTTGANPSSTNVHPFVMTTDTWYWVRFENDYQSETRLKIWAGALVDEPDGWTLRLGAGGQTGTLQNFGITVRQQGSTLTDLGEDLEIFVDDLNIKTGCEPIFALPGNGGPSGGSGRNDYTATASQTVFTTSSPYQIGTTQVYVNGYFQRPGIDYTESDPVAGEITLTSGVSAGTTVTIFYEALRI